MLATCHSRLLLLALAAHVGTACERSPTPIAPTSNESPSTPGDAEPSAPAQTESPQPATELATRPDCPTAAPAAGAHGTFYVCDCQEGASHECQPGSDEHAGTDSGEPWRTLERARAGFEALPAGGTIALCRGGAFRAPDKSWVNPQCRAGEPCVIVDYVPPASGKTLEAPLIRSNGNGFSFSNGGNARHEEGYLVANLQLVGSGEGTGVMFYNDIDHVTLCRLSIDGFSLGVHVAGSNPPEQGSDGLNSFISLLDSRIVNNKDQGWLGSCDHCSIERNHFENNGFAQAVLNHNIDVDGQGSHVRIVGNELYRSAIVDGKCQGASLVVHGVQQGLFIEKNSVKEDLGKADPGCWGIAVDAGYPSRVESFSDVSIKNNQVTNVGGVSIGVSSCQRCALEGNTVKQGQAFEAQGIAAPSRERGDGDAVLEQITITGNSVEIGPNGSGTGIVFGDEGNGHSLRNNQVHYRGRKAFQCFGIRASKSALGVNVNNACQVD